MMVLLVTGSGPPAYLTADRRWCSTISAWGGVEPRLHLVLRRDSVKFSSGTIRGIVKYDVFISHSEQDRRFADQACSRLEADGFRCWIDHRNMSDGAKWHEQIVE